MAISLFVFTFILLTGLVCSNLLIIGKRSTDPRVLSCQHSPARSFVFAIIPFIIISLLIGLRSNVGVDWAEYVAEYDYFNYRRPSFQMRFEWLYVMLMYILKLLSLPSYSIFIVTTFTVLILYYKSFNGMERLLPFGMYTMFTMEPFFLFLNIMRQMLSVFAVIFSIKYIRKKKFVYYLIGIFIASGFHKTAWLMLPFYLLAYYRKPLLNRNVSLIVYCFFWIAGRLFLGNILNLAMSATTGSYSGYLDRIETWEMGSGSGIGMLLASLCDIIVIWCMPQCYRFFKDKGYDIYYNLFFIGVNFANIVGLNLLLARIPLNLTAMRLIVGAFTLYLCFRYSNLFPKKTAKVKIIYKTIGIMFSLITLTVFFATIISFNYSFVKL